MGGPLRELLGLLSFAGVKRTVSEGSVVDQELPWDGERRLPYH